MLNAQYYLPDGTGPEVLAYWQPETAVISNDTMCVLSKAKSPVLAHLFIERAARQGPTPRPTSATSDTSRPSRGSAPRS